jgi:UDPglucose 6-dehydrogenase
VDRGETVVILRMSYKPDTYIVEESAGLYLAQHLKRAGGRVLVHDYAAAPSNSPSLHEFEVVENPKTLAERNGH